MPFQKFNKILCINDNEISLFILKRLINKTSLSEEVIEAVNGLEALTYCEKLIKDPEESEFTYPGIIFLDLHMPGMNGWDFLDHFSKSVQPFFKNTKIIITSHSINNKDLHRINNYPFIIDFLRNPVSVEYLNDLKNRLFENDLLPN